MTVIQFKKERRQVRFVASFTGASGEGIQIEGRQKVLPLGGIVRVAGLHEDEEPTSASSSRPAAFWCTRRRVGSAGGAHGRTRSRRVRRQDGELADKVDGHYFKASAGWFELDGSLELDGVRARVRG